MQWIYAITITRQDGDHVVHVRDLPEVVTSGDTHEEALALASDAIEVAVMGRMEDEEELPLPSPAMTGEIALPLSARLAAKASIYHLWRASGISKSELARRLQRTETEARRILDPRHGTKLDLVEQAAKALGGRLVLGLA
jgi:antitoxin HicB